MRYNELINESTLNEIGKPTIADIKMADRIEAGLGPMKQATTKPQPTDEAVLKGYKSAFTRGVSTGLSDGWLNDIGLKGRQNDFADLGRDLGKKLRAELGGENIPPSHIRKMGVMQMNGKFKSFVKQHIEALWDKVNVQDIVDNGYND